ncbi:CBN-CLEC-147 protein [Caenorhabditis brenneri]|uniref:CBN-CLEC-147 protein n=1 Tax=Caenorhabditis brenneri TaxID=135651 RepID=G0NZW9_CAEBE|nr:CBN-CLEC-147 protein [Caenorhabditis brenneri]
MFRPMYYGGGKEDCDCPDESTSSPISSTSTQKPVTETIRYSYTCPASDWHLFTRGENHWCVKFFPSETHISINNASEICKQAESELTGLENDEERKSILDEAKLHIIEKLNQRSGAVALAGSRTQECQTTNGAVLQAAPCNDPTKVYVLPASAATNPDFMWKNWADKEPSFSQWSNGEYENCLQLFINPSDSKLNGKINDFYCARNVAPNDDTDTKYWNFGALCGREADMEGVF